MLYIETDTVVFTGGVVYKVIQGGDFDNESLVEVYRDGNEDKTSIGAFQAHYVAFGYHYGEADPKDG